MIDFISICRDHPWSFSYVARVPAPGGRVPAPAPGSRTQVPDSPHPSTLKNPNEPGSSQKNRVLQKKKIRVLGFFWYEEPIVFQSNIWGVSITMQINFECFHICYAFPLLFCIKNKTLIWCFDPSRYSYTMEEATCMLGGSNPVKLFEIQYAGTL